MIRRLKQAGDTIVEVLIATAVAGIVLTGAYATATRSTLMVQDAQEHSQAVQYLQSQLELLRSYLTALPIGLTPYAFTGNECMVTPSGNAPIVYSAGTAGTGGGSSASVTGIGTTWSSSGIFAGELVTWQDGRSAAINTINSDTSITLNSPVNEPNTQSYNIVSAVSGTHLNMCPGHNTPQQYAIRLNLVTANGNVTYQATAKWSGLINNSNDYEVLYYRP